MKGSGDLPFPFFICALYLCFFTEVVTGPTGAGEFEVTMGCTVPWQIRMQVFWVRL